MTKAAMENAVRRGLGTSAEGVELQVIVVEGTFTHPVSSRPLLPLLMQASNIHPTTQLLGQEMSP